MGFCIDPWVSNYWINGLAVGFVKRYRCVQIGIRGAPLNTLVSECRDKQGPLWVLVNSKATHGSWLKSFDIERHKLNSNPQFIMKLKDAHAILKKVVGKDFSQIFTPQQLNQISNNTTNKGVVGQVLELSLGLTNNSTPSILLMVN